MLPSVIIKVAKCVGMLYCVLRLIDSIPVHICDCPSNNQPSSHLQFYQVKSL